MKLYNYYTRITFLRGPSEAVQLKGREKFRIETFHPIINTLEACLKEQLESYQEINRRFSFVSELKTIHPEHLRTKCREF